MNGLREQTACLLIVCSPLSVLREMECGRKGGGCEPGDLRVNACELVLDHLLPLVCGANAPLSAVFFV